MIKCPVCGKEMPERNTKCYACHSEFTYGKKGRVRSIVRGMDILQEKKRKLEEMQYESLPKKHCPTCGNLVTERQNYCNICGEEDAYIYGISLTNLEMSIKDNINAWELLQKEMIWEQLKFIHNKRVLDFGSGNGITADHFAIDNEVIAIEPDEKMLQNRFIENDYIQIKGDIKELNKFEDQSFDVILCHNVFEYAEEREEIIKEFSRILKNNGYLSILKHNRAGRVMQMVVLLNNFEHANELLEGKNGHAQQFGTINYYQDTEILKWSDKFKIERILGIRTFWDLQQNQDIQKDKTWQEQMLQMELKVSEMEEYKAIASFHHVILRKK